MTEEFDRDKAFTKAKFGLMKAGTVFLSTITFSLKHVFTDKVKTADTDGYTVRYNEEYFKSKTPAQRVALMGHEAWHVAFMHPVKMVGKQNPEYNYAADYLIDTMMDTAGFNVSEYGFVNHKYDGWSTNQIYKDILDKNKKPPQDYQPDIKSNSDDPGKTSAQIEQDQQTLKEHIKNILVAASTQSQIQGETPGNIPDEVAKVIDDLIQPKLPWDVLLNRYMDSFLKEDYTWKRPNKRFQPDFFLPSLYSEGLGEITVAVDTSGSISDAQYKPMLSELQYIWEKYQPEKMTIMDCDQTIHNIYIITRDSVKNITELKFSGEGGTSLNPPIEYCKKHKTKVLLYFTDLQARQITEDPGFPIIWLCYSNHEPAPIGETIYYDFPTKENN